MSASRQEGARSSDRYPRAGTAGLPTPRALLRATATTTATRPAVTATGQFSALSIVLATTIPPRAQTIASAYAAFPP